LADDKAMSAISSIGSAQVQLLQQVQTAVAKKTLDTMKLQGNSAVSLLAKAADFQQKMVAQVSAEPGKGALIDLTA
jgi:hypothetical protein